MNRRVSALLAIALMSLAGKPSAAGSLPLPNGAAHEAAAQADAVDPPETGRELVAGMKLERALQPSDEHVYTVNMEAGAGIIGEADQDGVDLVVDILGPDGQLIARLDSPNGTQGPEPFNYTALQPGMYKLVVHTLDKNAPPGKYVMKIERLLAPAENATRLAREMYPSQKLESVLANARIRNARDYAIATPGGIDEAQYVKIGGLEQWITIRGEDRNNPVLLLLHGGPGDATNPWGYAGFRSWMKHFTVVQWDQRGAGRTLGKNGRSSAATITIARMAQDGIELTEFLRQTLHQKKIILVGHSWGSILGIFMVKAHPEMFYAFIGTGQAASDAATNYTVAYEALLAKAIQLGEQEAIRELREVGPPPYANRRGYTVQRKWSNRFEGANFFIASMVGLALDAPGYEISDINDWLDGQLLSGDHLIPETSVLNATTLGGTFDLPVFVIQGADDFTTPTSLARNFVRSIHAPRKAFDTIDGGHFAVFMKSDAFLNKLLARVLPLIHNGTEH